MQTIKHPQPDFVIWRLLDGKPGHMHQSLGLVQAIGQQHRVQVHDVQVAQGMHGWAYWAAGVWPLGQGLPAPDMLVGAGHATHGHLLAAQRAYGGKTVCLMRPSVPVSLFDACLIPEHDHYRGAGSFIETRGVLNHIETSTINIRDTQQTLLLVGGPSKHYVWDDALVAGQIFALVHARPEMDFILTTSRRTPDSFLKALQRIHMRHLTIVPYAETDAGWVQRHLQRSHAVWVTEDSVSMIYEGLTAQAAVGLLNLPARKHSRVAIGIRKLVEQQLVTRFDLEGRYHRALRPMLGFNEAHRCSQLLLRHLMQPASYGGRLAETLA